MEPGHSAKGFYSVHINAFYDLERHTYTDALLQSVHQKDEFRAKDIHSKGLVGGFDFPDKEAFDIDADVTLVRSHSSKIKVESGCRRFVDKPTSFDFIEYGSKDTHCVTFRVVRFPIADGSYECVVTNLPRDKFPPACVRKLYKSWK